MGQVQLPTVAGLTYTRTVFLSSGTFTLPATAFNKFDCFLVSGGGGGAGANNTTPRQSFGGSGQVAYFHDIFCSNETTLTVTVGAGGTGGGAGVSGNAGNLSEITGLAGNGASTSLSTAQARAGQIGLAGGNGGALSPQLVRSFSNNGNSSAARAVAVGFGFGSTSAQSGQRYRGGYANANLTIFGSGAAIRSYINGNNTVVEGFMRGGTGGPTPLLGSLLHATTGNSGTAGQSSGAISNANTYFAGTGGGSEYGGSQQGFGGGGGAGGQSNDSSIASGSGGNASTNSGAGGGAGGQNRAGGSLLGTGGNGGSGFVVIGFWG